MITVWEKPNCQPCKMTKRQMDKEGVTYQVKQIESAPQKTLNLWKAEGHMSAPIVDTGTEIWSGYRPDRIKALVKEVAA